VYGKDRLTTKNTKKNAGQGFSLAMFVIAVVFYTDFVFFVVKGVKNNDDF
jgi:hypothetical protein